MPDVHGRQIPTPPRRPMRVPDAAAYLLGAWEVERDLLERATGAEGTFRGTATFGGAEHGEDVEHLEHGELTWAGVVRTAQRSLRLRPASDGTAHVLFPDGRAFHDLDLRQGAWTAVHPCAADAYTGTFAVISPDEWRARWDVIGPGKDQTISTVYRRRAPESRPPGSGT